MAERVFVLVHPAWFGGWCWRKVASRLRGAGHPVYTPTLTGLGDRAHLAHREVGLATHVDDIVNLLVFEDLEGVVLVGSSSSGAVITGVAAHVPQRVEPDQAGAHHRADAQIERRACVGLDQRLQSRFLFGGRKIAQIMAGHCQ